MSEKLEKVIEELLDMAAHARVDNWHDMGLPPITVFQSKVCELAVLVENFSTYVKMPDAQLAAAYKDFLELLYVFDSDVQVDMEYDPEWIDGITGVEDALDVLQSASYAEVEESLRKLWVVNTIQLWAENQRS